MFDSAHFYRLYHLPVCSDLVLPELCRTEVLCEVLDSSITAEFNPVVIRRGPNIDMSEIEKKPWFSATGFTEARLRHPGFGELIIKAGQEIEIRSLPKASESLIRLYLLGSAMGCILHQRRIIPLHVSVVSIKGQAWGFTAPSGTGKSTLAARLHRFGNCPMVSDDVAALYMTSGQPYVAGGPPVMKLRQEFARLYDDAHITPIPHPESNKVKVQVNNSFVSGLMPLAGIVVLERNSRVPKGGLELERLTGAGVFLGGREAVYRYQMGLAMSSPAYMFDKLAEFTKQVPFYRGLLGDWTVTDGGTQEPHILDQLARI